MTTKRDSTSLVSSKRQKLDEPIDPRLLPILLQLDFFSYAPTETFLALACTCKMFRDRLDAKGLDFWLEHLKWMHQVRGERFKHVSFLFLRFARLIFTSYLLRRCVTCHKFNKKCARYGHIRSMYLCGSCDPPFVLISRPRAVKKFHLKTGDLKRLPSIHLRTETYLESDVREKAIGRFGSPAALLGADANSAKLREDKLAREKLYPRYRTNELEGELQKKMTEAGLDYDRFREPCYLSPLCQAYIYEVDQDIHYLLAATVDECRLRLLQECSIEFEWLLLKTNAEDAGVDEVMSLQDFEILKLREWCEKHPLQYGRIREWAGFLHFPN